MMERLAVGLSRVTCWLFGHDWVPSGPGDVCVRLACRGRVFRSRPGGVPL